MLGTTIVAVAGVTAIDVRVAGTVRRTVVLSMVLPDIPDTMMGRVPLAADEPTMILIVDVPVGAIDVGFNVTVTPAGTTGRDNVMVAVKPPVGVLLTVEIPELPCVTVTDAGDAERMNPLFDELPARSVIRPEPLGLPHPVAKSYPTVAE